MESVIKVNSTTSVRHRIALASLSALAAAGVAGLTLPASVFQSSAIVAVDEPTAALRLAAARSAADLAVSKPVIARAAASLNGTVVPVPVPALAEKIGVATGLVGATGAVARLADALAPTVSANAGDGLVEVQARAVDGARAARVATVLAEALVVEEEGSIAAAARRREVSFTARLEALRETARAAHARLAALGITETDPAEALAAAGAVTRAAEARLAAVHTVIAAGTPPLGAGSELPQSAATLQQTYWDLKKQLNKASETMGERHTTVIALRDGVSRAAASLTAEWQRIERGAASDVAVARSREAVLRKAASLSDPAKRAAADEARGAARLADAAVARAALAPAVSAVANPPFLLVAPAGVPAAATGLGSWQRGSIAVGAGAGAFLLTWLASARRRRGRPFAAAPLDEPAAIPSAEAAEAKQDTANSPVQEAKASSARPEFAGPPFAADETSRVADEPRAAAIDVAEAAIIQVADEHHEPDYDYFASEWPVFEPEDLVDEGTLATPFDSASFDARPGSSVEPHRASAAARTLDPDLRDALRAVAADLEALAPGHATTITVLVAADAAGADAGAVALALGEAAAELGYRVLVIEGEHARPALAEAVAPDGDPLLVNGFGASRVVLPAGRGDGLLLAPAFRDGARIAAALARNTQADFVDDLAADLDAAVIEGGRAADSAAAGWSADAFICVGRSGATAGWSADAFIRVDRFASQGDDACLLDAFDAPPEALLGTLAAARFAARETVAEPRAAWRPILRAAPGSFDVPSPRRPTAAPTRRRIVAR